MENNFNDQEDKFTTRVAELIQVVFEKRKKNREKLIKILHFWLALGVRGKEGRDDDLDERRNGWNKSSGNQEIWLRRLILYLWLQSPSPNPKRDNLCLTGSSHEYVANSQANSFIIQDLLMMLTYLLVLIFGLLILKKTKPLLMLK